MHDRSCRLKKALAVLLVLAMLPAEALACTAIYVGSNLTADGSTIFARLEEYTSDERWPKLFEVIPEGAHAAGDTIDLALTLRKYVETPAVCVFGLFCVAFAYSICYNAKK